MSDSMFGRSGISHPLGKCSGSVEAPVPDCVVEQLLKFGARNGDRGRAELVRDLVVRELYGEMLAMGAKVRTDGTVQHRKISLDDAIAGLAFVRGMSPEAYRAQVLATHVFGALHVEKHGAVGTAEQSECDPDISG